MDGTHDNRWYTVSKWRQRACGIWNGKAIGVSHHLSRSFLGGAISSRQYAGLFDRRRHDEQFLRELLPEGGEKGIDKSLSLGLCRGDTVIGWLVAVRIRSDLIEYSALCVEPKYRSSGAAVLLLGEAFLRLAAARVEHVIFQVKIENDLMLRFVRKRFHVDMVGNGDIDTVDSQDAIWNLNPVRVLLQTCPRAHMLGMVPIFSLAGLSLKVNHPKRSFWGTRGVADALDEPDITLFSGSAVIGHNNDWTSSDRGSEIAELEMAPEDSKEAAILMERDPGTYTVHLRGAVGDAWAGIIAVDRL
jgi:ribosomal protein S18 acetylase RimI-like enzyme